ncbi:hypothetical protein CBS147346_8479 [Aspergillus niger]|nr:hypothetical protein CBS147346_8479 [Aspergillus niger]
MARDDGSLINANSKESSNLHCSLESSGSDFVQCLAKTKGTLLDFKYMTFDTGSQKVLGSYGAENIKLMQEVAAKYDPEGVFQKLQNGGFLLLDNI